MLWRRSKGDWKEFLIIIVVWWRVVCQNITPSCPQVEYQKKTAKTFFPLCDISQRRKEKGSLQLPGSFLFRCNSLRSNMRRQPRERFLFMCNFSSKLGSQHWNFFSHATIFDKSAHQKRKRFDDSTFGQKQRRWVELESIWPCSTCENQHCAKKSSSRWEHKVSHFGDHRDNSLSCAKTQCRDHDTSWAACLLVS